MSIFCVDTGWIEVGTKTLEFKEGSLCYLLRTDKGAPPSAVPDKTEMAIENQEMVMEK